MLNRTIPPPIYKARLNRFLEPEKQWVNTHLPMYIFQVDTPPVVKFEIVFNTGKRAENNVGAAYFTSKMWLEGTATKSAQEVAEYIAYYGAHIDIWSSEDFTTLQLTCLTKHFGPTLAMLHELLTAPCLPESALPRLKNICKKKLQVEDTKNHRVAYKQLLKALFGDQHAYGRILTKSTADNMNIAAIQSYYQQQWAQPATLFLGGHIESSMVDMVKEYFKDYSPTSAIQSDTKSPIHTLPATRVHIDKPKSLQSSIYMGIPTIPIHHADYWALHITNTLLGGYFGSRLMQKIREEKGYTYGIQSRLVNWQQANYLLISTDVIKAYQKNTVDAIHTEIRQIQQGNIADEEIQRVKSYMVGNLLNKDNNAFSMMHLFKQVYVHGLTNAYYDKLYQTLSTIDRDTIAKVAQKYLKTDNFTEVIVG